MGRQHVSDILFDFERQFREKRALWRLFELAPLRLGLAQGRIFRWFGINIPFSLVGGQGDIDLLMALRDLPGRKPTLIYETLELKTTLITRLGRAISLKASSSKTKQLIGQLKKYRELGSPSVGLFEIYICEDGFFENQTSLPREVLSAIEGKLDSVSAPGFGYSIAVIQHDRTSERESNRSNYLGLRAMAGSGFPSTPIKRIRSPLLTDYRPPFTQLTSTLENFVEGEINARRTTLGKCIVTYCVRCRGLITVDHRSDYRCGNCGNALVMQTV
jgi:hypothetical protein